MKNRVKLIVALLASVLVVCGMFTLTSFADDTTPAPTTHTHSWIVKQPTAHESTYPGSESIAFHCTDKSCKYYKWQFVRLIAKDAIAMDGVDYLDGEDDNIAFAGDTEAFDECDAVELGDCVFYSGSGEKLKKVPSEAGTYKIEYPVIVNGKKAFDIAKAFRILTASVVVEEGGWEYGSEPSTITVTVDGKRVNNEDCTFYYHSLENEKAELTETVPTKAGHYEVMALIPKTETRSGGIAETEFEIRQLAGGLTVTPITVSLSKLKNIDISNANMSRIAAMLLAEGVVNPNCQYGDPILVNILYGNEVYNPLKMGKLIIKYSGTTKAGKSVSGLFVPGMKLPAGDYTLKVRIAESKNNAYAYKEETFAVNQIVPELIKAPKAKKLVDNGMYQELVTPGKVKDGKILYKLEDGNWSSLVPTAKGEGPYNVYYKVIATDSNHTDGNEVAIPVRIYRADDPEATAPENDDHDYDAGNAVPAVSKAYARAGKKSIVVLWDAINSADLEKVSKIEIQYSKDENFKRGVKKVFVSKNKTSYKIKHLKKGAKYYVRVRNVKYNNFVNSDGIDTTVILKEASGWSVRSAKVK